MLTMQFRRFVACLALSFVTCPYALSITSLTDSKLAKDSGQFFEYHNYDHFQHESNSTSDLVSRQSPMPPEWLRIMPLGASIVRGLRSTPEDGFRKVLRAKLREQGFKVNMVGSMFNSEGSMKDGDHEGHSGNRIDQIMNDFNSNRNTRPNLVLINAGTNDCQQNWNEMRDSMNNLKDLVYLVKQYSPETTIILSTLLPSSNEEQAPGADNRVTALNREIRKWVWSLSSREKVVLAEMNDDEFLFRYDLVDGIHPNQQGYRKMASVWFDAIQEALRLGMITEPLEGSDGPDDAPPASACEKIPGQGDGPYLTQRGFGYDDGPYRHKGTKVADIFRTRLRGKDAYKRIGFGHVISNNINYPPSAALDEIILWNRLDIGNQQYIIRLEIYANMGDGSFTRARDEDMPFDCSSQDIRWADVNGDVLDDFICVESNGDVRVAVTKRGSDGRPQFNDVGVHMRHPDGYEGRHVRLGDIDGDGRADYCVIGDDGFTYCWRNGGLGDKAEYWQDFGMTFAPKGKGDIRGTRFVDINGDFRSDWIWVGDKGETDIYTNMRGPRSGASVQERLGLVPNWIHAQSFHGGMNVPGVRDQIHLARIFGKDGSGRRDYVYVEAVNLNNGDSGDWDFYFQTWRNDGSGGTERKSDWDRYGDITGDGRDDYLQIRPNGDVEAWININQPGEWERPGIIHNIGSVDPKAVHLADWDGDGKADILVVDKESGRITFWPNKYIGSGRQYYIDAFRESQAFGCSQGWGVGIFDLGVRFADIDGDGRADYLCMDKDGRTQAVLNREDGAEFVGQIKFSEKKDRANHRFADVNGDGKADFLWIDKWNGEVHVWYNQGRRSNRPEDGSIWQWQSKGKLYNGVDRGPNEYFLDYDGDGRADILRVNPEDNTAEVWYNKCSGGGGGAGDDANVDTDTPKYPPDPQDIKCTLNVCESMPWSCPDDPEEPDGFDDIEVRRRGLLVKRVDNPFDIGNGKTAIVRRPAYPRGAAAYLSLYGGLGDRRILLRWFRYFAGSCRSLQAETIREETIDTTPDGRPVVPDYPFGTLNVEHIIDRGIVRLFIIDAVNNQLPSGETDNLPVRPLPREFFTPDAGLWDTVIPRLADRGSVGNLGTGPQGQDRGRPVSRFMEAFGTNLNTYPLMLAEANFNSVKGRVFQLTQAWVFHDSSQRIGFRARARAAAESVGFVEADNILSELRTLAASFAYINRPAATERFQQVLQDSATEMRNIEEDTTALWQQQYPNEDLPLLQDWWEAWIADFTAEAGRLAREWMIDAVETIREEYEIVNAPQRANGNPDTPVYRAMMVALRGFLSELDFMYLPGVPRDENPDPDQRAQALQSRLPSVNNMTIA